MEKTKKKGGKGEKSRREVFPAKQLTSQNVGPRAYRGGGGRGRRKSEKKYDQKNVKAGYRKGRTGRVWGKGRCPTKRACRGAEWPKFREGRKKGKEYEQENGGVKKKIYLSKINNGITAATWMA